MRHSVRCRTQLTMMPFLDFLISRTAEEDFTSKGYRSLPTVWLTLSINGETWLDQISYNQSKKTVLYRGIRKSGLQTNNYPRHFIEKCIHRTILSSSDRQWVASIKQPFEPVVASCHLYLHACDWSVFARGLSIDSRAYVNSQHVRWPIRTPEWSSRLSDQKRILFTQPRCTPEHERQLVTPFKRLYCPYYIFLPHLSVFGHRAILIWGDLGIDGGCS